MDDFSSKLGHDEHLPCFLKHEYVDGHCRTCGHPEPAHLTNMTNRPKTWREAIQRLSEYPAAPMNLTTLANHFRETEGWWDKDWKESDRRLKRHWIHSWMCTDTLVGISVITLDGEPVAISGQQARKSDEEIEFLSEEAAAKVLKAVKELGQGYETPENKHAFLNLDEEIDESWFERQ